MCWKATNRHSTLSLAKTSAVRPTRVTPLSISQSCICSRRWRKMLSVGPSSWQSVNKTKSSWWIGGIVTARSAWICRGWTHLAATCQLRIRVAWAASSSQPSSTRVPMAPSAERIFFSLIKSLKPGLTQGFNSRLYSSRAQSNSRAAGAMRAIRARMRYQCFTTTRCSSSLWCLKVWECTIVQRHRRVQCTLGQAPAS